MRLHICAGYLTITAGLVHGVLHAYNWVIVKNLTRDDIFPARQCFKKAYDEVCYNKFVNLIGVINGLCFLVTGIAAMWWVRRNHYRVFYWIHVTVACILLFTLAMHYNQMIFWMSPSILYYCGHSIPVAIESLYKWWCGGVRVSKVVFIPNSRGCVEITIPRCDYSNSMWNNAEIENAVGKYVKLSVPRIHRKSHPFSIFYNPNYPDHIKILFKPIGKFSTSLPKQLGELANSPEDSISRVFPKVLVNGIFVSGYQWEQVMRHDNVVIVAGGVGLNPYISLLAHLSKLRYDSSVSSEETDADDATTTTTKTKHVELHWACRDVGLIDHITETYLKLCDNEIGSSDWNFCSMSIHIYHTGASASTVDDIVGNAYCPEPKEEGTYERPVSLYEGRKMNVQDNILSAVTFSAIAFGGYGFTRYCFFNIQEKGVVHTRAICVFGILLGSIVLSLGALVAVKVYRVYFLKVDKENSSLRDRIESTIPEELDNITSIMSHTQGRPDLSTIIKDAFGRCEDDDKDNDIVIFTCGPSTMMDAVTNAARKEKQRCGCVQARVYREVFEM